MRLLHVAVELAAYRLEHGEYPERFDDLGKETLANLPEDLYTEKPFLYERRGNGYLLYSVGANQQDNSGSSDYSGTYKGEWITDGTEDDLENNHDDIVIRLPLPPFQWPKLDAIDER